MSELTLIPHDPSQEIKPYWFKGPEGYVSVGCGICGKRAILQDPLSVKPRKDGTRGHFIAPDGVVTPSIMCPYKPCPWHIWGRLLNWVA